MHANIRARRGDDRSATYAYKHYPPNVLSKKVRTRSLAYSPLTKHLPFLQPNDRKNMAQWSMSEAETSKCYQSKAPAKRLHQGQWAKYKKTAQPFSPQRVTFKKPSGRAAVPKKGHNKTMTRTNEKYIKEWPYKKAVATHDCEAGREGGRQTRG